MGNNLSSYKMSYLSKQIDNQKQKLRKTKGFKKLNDENDEAAGISIIAESQLPSFTDYDD